MANGAVGGSPVAGGHQGSTWIIYAVAGGVLHLVVGFFTITAVGLIGIPLWAALALVGAWLITAALLVRTVRSSPLMAIAAPVANGALLWALTAAGQQWWGWTG